jgi:hypothetical protein
MMFEYLLESNNLRPEFERCGLNETDVKFIEEQIAGPLASEMSSQLNAVSQAIYYMYVAITGRKHALFPSYFFFNFAMLITI